MHSGEFEEAFNEYSNVLHSAKNNTDSIRAYNGLQNYYLMRGEVIKSLENYENRMNILERLLSPKEYMVRRVMTIEPYIHANKFDEAISILEAVEKELEPPVSDIVPFGYLFIYAETGDTARAREAIASAEKLIEGFGEEVLRANLYYVQGKIEEHIGNYEEAAEYYYKCLEMNATNYFFHNMIARCYRNLGNNDKAEEEIGIALKYRPFNPTNNYEAALLYLGMGDEEKGIEYLERAVNIWDDADPEYERAGLAKEKLNSLNSVSPQ